MLLPVGVRQGLHQLDLIMVVGEAGQRSCTSGRWDDTWAQFNTSKLKLHFTLLPRAVPAHGERDCRGGGIWCTKEYPP